MILTLRGFFATIISDFNERNDSMLLLDDLRIELEGYRPLIKELYSDKEVACLNVYDYQEKAYQEAGIGGSFLL